MNCILEKFPGNFGDPRVICSVMNGSPTGEEGMTPPLAHDPPNAAPDEGPAVSRLTAGQAHEVIAAGRGGPVDTPDARVFDKAHPPGALSLPLSPIEAAPRHPPPAPPAPRPP